MLRLGIAYLLLSNVACASWEALNFNQRRDHFDASSTATFQQRYYLNTDHWQPGGPLFHILGGESPIEPQTAFGMYPFVSQVLAERLHGMVLVTEHRYFGESLPFGPERSFAIGNGQGMGLINVEQALRDFLGVAAHVSHERCGASLCPVIALGGSYPGLLATMIRVRYPDSVYASLAASAPLGFLAGSADPYGWFRVVTEAAAAHNAECPAATRRMFAAIAQASSEELVRDAGFCDEGFSDEFFHQEAVALVRSNIATYAMGNYPPQTSPLGAACSRIVAADTGLGAARAMLLEGDSDLTCASIRAELPSGPGGKIECVDKTGCGGGRAGQAWEYMGCTWLRIGIATNNVTDMFPVAGWSEAQTAEHCMRRFGVTPAPSVLPERFSFNSPRELSQVASRIVFTNGLRDGWSVGGILESPSPDLPALVMANGAHHSEMGLPNGNDTSDVIATRDAMEAHLRMWLLELKFHEGLPLDQPPMEELQYGVMFANEEQTRPVVFDMPLMFMACLLSALGAFAAGSFLGAKRRLRTPQREGPLLG